MKIQITAAVTAALTAGVIAGVTMIGGGVAPATVPVAPPVTFHQAAVATDAPAVVDSPEATPEPSVAATVEPAPAAPVVQEPALAPKPTKEATVTTPDNTAAIAAANHAVTRAQAAYDQAKAEQADADATAVALMNTPADDGGLQDPNSVASRREYAKSAAMRAEASTQAAKSDLTDAKAKRAALDA